MKQEKYLFIHPDGTLISEPEDNQIDSINKLKFMPQVFNGLFQLKKADYKFVIISNQDGLGSENFPENDFNIPHEMMLNIFKSQGIEFEDVRICPHLPNENCECRKPKIGLILDYLIAQKIDMSYSYVIGDRDTDLELAKNLNLQYIQIGKNGINNWLDVTRTILKSARYSTVNRKTKETDIRIMINLDNEDDIEINTGMKFFDHMLEQVVKHAAISAKIDAKGDLNIDDHHTIEDVAIAFGTAIKDALGDKRGTERYGFLLPMDESRAMVTLDLSGRTFCQFECKFNREKIGGMSTEMISHFFRSFSKGLGATLHIEITGENTHHMCESAFKGLGRTLKQAIRINSSSIPSTKGVL